MNEHIARPWVPYSGEAVDLFFEDLSGPDVKKVIQDLKAGKSVRIPAWRDQPSRVISINDLDERALAEFKEYMGAYPWERMQSKSPNFRYVGGEYMPIHENASPEAVVAKFASALRGKMFKAIESDRPSVFLGGQCQDDNKWRKSVIEEFGDDFAFIDPTDDDWEAEDNIYDELASLLNVDYVLFYRGGKGTDREKRFLNDVGSGGAYEEFDSLDGLFKFLRDVRDGKREPKPALARNKKANSDGEYDHATTQVDLPKELGDKIIAWGKRNVPDADLKEDEDGTAGREDEMHVTLLYGLKGDKVTDRLRSLVGAVKPFEVRLGLVTVFKDSDKQDVIKIDAESPELQDLHYAIEKAVPNVNSYPTYVPHITIAYVKKGRGDRVLGDDTFRGRTFKVDKVTFKSSDKDVEEIPLRGSAA